MPDQPGKSIPRRGRIWILIVLALALVALGYVIVEASTREPGPERVSVAGISDAQRLIGGMPQYGDRLGSANAPVTIQIFNDVQCRNCAEDFLSTFPTLAEDYARAGEAKLIFRHYSNSIKTEQLGFFGAEAAAKQGYGWQYIYLFFRNQDQADEFGIDEEYLGAIADGIEKLDKEEWETTLAEEGGPEGPIAEHLAGDEELGSDLGIRIRQSVIVSGPGGSELLQDAPSLAAIEAAIAAVS